MDGAADGLVAEGGHAQGFRNQPDLETTLFPVDAGNGQAGSVQGDIPLGKEIGHPGFGNADAHDVVVFGVTHLDQGRDEVDMARKRVATDLRVAACGPFDVKAIPHLKLAEPSQSQGLLHQIEACTIGAALRHRQTDSIAGDAGTEGQFVIEAGRKTQNEVPQAGLVVNRFDGGNALDDSGEHGSERSRCRRGAQA